MRVMDGRGAGRVGVWHRGGGSRVGAVRCSAASNSWAGPAPACVRAVTWKRTVSLFSPGEKVGHWSCVPNYIYIIFMYIYIYIHKKAGQSYCVPNIILYIYI